MDRIDWQKKGAGHRQRLRDRFLDRGLESFTDAEVLELLLTLGTPRRDCKEPARELLSRFKTLAAVLDAPAFELQRCKGVGPKNSFAIGFVQAVARRYLAQRLEGRNYLRSSRQVAEYLVHAMRHLKREVLLVLFLDAGYGILASEIVFEGTLTVNAIHPRELIKQALRRHAAALVIAHNHPSGRMAPSESDRRLTRNLFLACAFVDIQLLDHFIVGGGESPFSFADHGIMAEIKAECAPILAGA